MASLFGVLTTLGFGWTIRVLVVVVVVVVVGVWVLQNTRTIPR